jgi:hypothetical protein
VAMNACITFFKLFFIKPVFVYPNNPFEKIWVCIFT